MKQINTLYYLLFVLLVMGGFAAMAQNGYGITILGIVAITFALIFLFQFTSTISSGTRKWIPLVEWSSLSILSAVMALRVFHVHFQFVEVIFAVAGVLLIVVYGSKLLQASWSLGKSGYWLWIFLCFYLSLIFYTFSMLSVAFLPVASEPSGMAAFALMVVFLGSAFYFKSFLDNGEKTTAFQWLRKSNDASLVLMALFLIFTLYLGLTKINAIPQMYSDEYPQAYFELVRKAESGKDKPVNGVYRHEKLKATYDQFLKHHPLGTNK